MVNRYAVILAAGQGTRMKSKLYKVLHPVCGKPMIQHIVDELNGLSFDRTVTVIGHGAEAVKRQLGQSTEYALQEKQLGTAHAVNQTAPLLNQLIGTTVVLCGDTPLITKETIKDLLDYHDKTGASATVLTTIMDNPFGYGRIIRKSTGELARIVEEKDTTQDEKLVKEINTGIYCFDNQKLFETLKKVNNNNAQGEYYLPDVIEILTKSSEKVAAYSIDNEDETIGVNDRVALSIAEKLMRKRINEHHMRSGVTLIDPDTTYLSSDCQIGPDTIIYPGTSIKGKTMIGEQCEIGPHTEIMSCEIGVNTSVKQSVLENSSIGNDVHIGPFAHIRPESHIGDEVKIGNFVEVKKSTIGNRSKASHLTYIGDSEIGKDVNFGCGSITVNYDGKNKYLTRVEDGAFIGCNANLIAPVTVGKGAFIAAGSTITQSVNDDSLAIARARQVNKENYTHKLEFKKNK
ncbi:bifunctional UDP-N-acetylglucosamine diphosphorylase/glucosamine-1-phosphate N-acetyltransferase GlmU [Terrilactibacillus sp. BCM23-1]|uniref:Bifunctional protein GlmU n=1 Tax=Terrilactibacillus tamarindi TaxID=2599694 RepID=A0A6N8CS38_9BACI|nr:bifunctional UDP-N-acetylglucosamine diphosphorylase/glucosamine-1-phosphate N-acetyltransferase GlmU [Terrilactibacillus tamarindi]MTT32984.1 bifunctional UDP-N-acetylglucosamine diphosphorylase/glucosamine-1-phosphate N-acetyltransferase GlmU [Terrilactibacillus tamarindi]